MRSSAQGVCACAYSKLYIYTCTCIATCLAIVTSAIAVGYVFISYEKNHLLQTLYGSYIILFTLLGLPLSRSLAYMYNCQGAVKTKLLHTKGIKCVS